MALQAGQEISYQRLLRALGGYLDHQPQSRFRLVELPDGFTVLLERGSTEPQLSRAYFERVTLAEQAEELIRGRKVFGRGERSRWKLCDASHEDFMRALGYELDDSEARGLSMDELEDALVVTYSYLDPAQGYSWRKQFVTLHADDMQEILAAAHDRKQRGFLSALRR